MGTRRRRSRSLPRRPVGRSRRWLAAHRRRGHRNPARCGAEAQAEKAASAERHRLQAR